MDLKFDSQKLGAMIRSQHANRPFRKIAEEIGDVSASTLCRLEKGHHPDMYVFVRICAWLSVSPERFFKGVASDGELVSADYSHGQIIELIRSDRKLALTTANVLSAFVSAAYQISE